VRGHIGSGDETVPKRQRIKRTSSLPFASRWVTKDDKGDEVPPLLTGGKEGREDDSVLSPRPGGQREPLQRIRVSGDHPRPKVRMAIRELGKKPATAGGVRQRWPMRRRLHPVATQTIRVWVREGRLTGYHAGRFCGCEGQSLRTSSPPARVRPSTTQMSPEELADRDFRQRQAAGRERRSNTHGRLPGGAP